MNHTLLWPVSFCMDRWAKGMDLLMQAGELGSVDALNNAASLMLNHPNPGAEVVKKAKKLYAQAAMKGSCGARIELAKMEKEAGNIERFYKHLIVATRFGDEESVVAVKNSSVGQRSLSLPSLHCHLSLLSALCFSRLQSLVEDGYGTWYHRLP